MNQPSNYYVFADISILIDYCNVQGKSSEDSRELLNKICENNGRVAIGKEAGKELTSRIINKQRLFQFLFNEASEYLKKYDNPETKFKAEVLNYTTIEEELPKGLNRIYLPKIREMRKMLDRVGLKEFRRYIHIVKKQTHKNQLKLEKVIIDERVTQGGQETFYLEVSLNDLCEDEAQVQSLLNGIQWCQGNIRERKNILVRHTDEVYQRSDEFQNCLPSQIRDVINVFSPQDALMKAKA